ncbi:MAG: hypothetical protein GY738_13905 [Pseudoalteromonas sp.]|nr:hypothetical protein [Pseudoalteromonas sp.]
MMSSVIKVIIEKEKLKAKIEGILEFAHYIVETGQLSKYDNEFIVDFAREVEKEYKKGSKGLDG